MISSIKFGTTGLRTFTLKKLTLTIASLFLVTVANARLVINPVTGRLDVASTGSSGGVGVSTTSITGGTGISVTTTSAGVSVISTGAGNNFDVQSKQNGVIYGDNGFQYDSSVSSVTLVGGMNVGGVFLSTQAIFNRSGSGADWYAIKAILTSAFLNSPISIQVPNNTISGIDFITSGSAGNPGKLDYQNDGTGIEGFDVTGVNGNSIVRYRKPIQFSLIGGEEGFADGQSPNHFVILKASNTITSDFKIVLPASVGSVGQVPTIISVTQSTCTLAFVTPSNGGGGSSSLAVGTGTASNFTTSVTSPTAAISFLGTQFNSTSNGTTNFISLNSSIGVPAGSDKQLQYNNAGSFGGLASSSATSSGLILAAQSATDVPLIIKATTSQTGDLLKFKNISNTDVLAISTSGYVYKDGNLFIHNTGVDSTFIGSNAGNITQAGNVFGNNTVIGNAGMAGMTNAYYNTVIGSNSGIGLTSGNSNVIVGAQSGRSISTGVGNTVIGSQSLDSCTSGSANVAIGESVSNSLVTSNVVIAVGAAVFPSLVSGGNEAGFGANVLNALTTGSGNTGIGNNIADAELGNNNTYVGIFSGPGANSQSNDGAVGIGFANFYSGFSANRSIGIGYEAGRYHAGDNNVIIGNEAGATNTNVSSGTNVVLLGANTDVGFPGIHDAVALGGGAIIDKSNSFIVGGIGANSLDFGLNNSTPGAKIHAVIDTSSKIGEIMQGASSQSANLMQWQNSSGVVLSSVDANGNITVSTINVRKNIQANGLSGTAGQCLQSNGPGVADSWGSCGSGGGSGSSIYQATSTAGFPFGFSASTASYSGRVLIGTTTDIGAQLYIVSNSTTIPLVIQDPAVIPGNFGSADLTDWRNTQGVNLSSVTADGSFVTSSTMSCNILIAAVVNVSSGNFTAITTSTDSTHPVPVVSSCGSGAVVSAGATDTSGLITPGPGATSCTLTFGLQKIRAPACVVSGSALIGLTSSTSASALTITGSSLFGDTISYICFGNQ